MRFAATGNCHRQPAHNLSCCGRSHAGHGMTRVITDRSRFRDIFLKSEAGGWQTSWEAGMMPRCR